MKVLVTGGSRGIGAAIVELYRKKGYTVESPTRQEMDLSDYASVQRFISARQGNGDDIIINNAGCNCINEIDCVTDEDMQEMMRVNLLSPVCLLRGLVPHMKKQHFGRIVNIGSIWGTITKAGRSIYSATKHGIHGITMTLAIELAPFNILVNTVAPGQTMTDLTRKNNSESAVRQMEQDIPVGRLATPEEIAKVVFFVGNEDNTYLTGQQILVDGGLTIQ